MHRRSFLRDSLYSSFFMASSGRVPLLSQTQSKRILVLGGTLFLGPQIVDAALADGHTVTIFNRGITNPGLFPNVERLKGFRSADRDDQDLSALGHRRWDVVIDVWPNDPALAQSAAELLKDRTEHYLYVSSIGAYDPKDFDQPNVAETAALVPWDAPARAYDRGKAESERRLRSIIGEKLTIVRPGPIKGVRDDTPDMLVWLRRLQSRSSVIAPGDGTDPVEIVDVKDVAQFLLLAIDHSLHGTFNVTGKEMSFRTFLEACKSATHSTAELVWIPEQFFHQNNPENWYRNYPFYRPGSARPNFFRVSSQKAYDNGWQTRPLLYTAIDYLTYIGSLTNYSFQDPLSKAQQDELLTQWRAHAG